MNFAADMIKRILLIAFCTANLFLLNSCKPECGDVEEKYYYLNAGDTSKVAYTGNETLRFLKNNTDTMEFIGQGFVRDFDEFLVAGGDCYEEKQFLEARDLVFENEIQNIEFSVYLAGPLSGNIGVLYKNSFYVKCTCGFRAPYEVPSITLNGITYGNINKIYAQPGDTGSYVLYKKDIGILKIKSGSDILTILK
jgi:hypothetical protein